MKAPLLLVRLSRAVEARPYAAFVLCVLFVTVSAVLSVGWLQADEHARVLEPAHYIVYGFATLPWELDAAKPLVSFFLGAVHAVPLYLARAAGCEGLGQAAVLRAFSGLVSLTRFFAFAGLVEALGLRRDRRILYTVLFAASPFTFLLLPRTSQENWATTAAIWGLYILLRALAAPARRSLAAGAGALLTLAFACRYQMGPSALCIGVWGFLSLWRRGGGRAAGAFAAGALLGLLPLGLVDLVMTGRPFLPAYNYLAYALTDEDGADLWGKQPWTTYLVGFFGNFYPPLSVVLLPLIIAGLIFSLPLALVVVPFVAVHLAISHKEIRYLTPMMPFWTLAVFGAVEQLERRWPQGMRRVPWRGLGRFGAVSLALGLFAALVPLNPQPFFYDAIRRGYASGELHKPYTFVANSRSSVSQFYLNDPAAAPGAALSIQEFVAQLAGPQPPHGDFALQRIPVDELGPIEAHCTGVYASIPAWHRHLLEALRGIVKFRYLDGIYRCP